MRLVDAQHQSELELMRHNYFGYLQAAVGTFEAAILQLKGSPMPAPSLHAARDLAHKIKGNAFMYGFPGLGLKADRVESALMTEFEKDNIEPTLFILIDIIDNIEDICSSTNKSEPVRLYPSLAIQDKVEVPCSQSEPSHLNRKSILIAYQDQWISNLLKTLIEGEYDVMECADEAGIMTALKHCTPDLLILDNDLPHDDVLPWLEKPELHATNIFLTFNSEDYEPMAAAISAGVSGFCGNKFDVLEITYNVRDLLEQPAKRILIADDDLAVREMLRYHLESEGLYVDVVNDGIEALEYLNKEVPDLIILDRYMPRLEGGTVLYEIQNKANLKSTPVLILTAMVNRGEAKTWFERGAADFIPKPFDPEEVTMRVKKHLKSRRSSS